VFEISRQDVTGPERANLQEWANYGLIFWPGAAVNFYGLDGEKSR